MTNREWVALNPMWKGPYRRAYVKTNLSYAQIRMHLMINTSNMDIKSAFFKFRFIEPKV